ncbi:RRP15-like protein isoform X2 [Sparus aurata]|uniref:RRP15-like protein isoform X2 n=1 Tax=Sparus aurata TaxID=8175 RepID=UPI0011C104E4|nr:RRP15-like protein isoform X2 [Sparus aurata]
MAALLETHVDASGANEEPQFEDNDYQSDSVGGSNDERSDDEASDGGSDGEDADDTDGGKNEGDDGTANAGWAEAMAKILGKKASESNSGILVKNKELDKIKEKERQEQLERKKQVDKKRAWEMMYREKPDKVKDRETERTLQRVATRGVVQLFNAVKKHQKTIDAKVKEVGGSERKKAKFLSSVSKKDFIDVLRRTEGGSEVPRKTEKAAAAEEKPAWSVLRDDFMMGGTMKDWDKDSDTEEPDTHSQGQVEESDSD